MMQELKEMTMAGKVGVTTGKPEITSKPMLNAIGDSLNNLARSEDVQDGEENVDDEEDTDLGRLSDDDEPGWVMGTISKMVQHRMGSFRPTQIRLDELTQLGWRDAVNFFRVRDMTYVTAKLKVPAVVKP
jgi:hypothetical protein